MTCTIQKIKSEETMQEWKAIFPDFTTITGSSLFIKKLMAVTVSAITYMRGVFPEIAYGERHVCGIKLKLLTEDSGIEGVNKFINLIRSCYDAVDKQYLHRLSIGICNDPEDKDNVLESYNMNLRYRDDKLVSSSKSRYVNLTEKDPTVTETLRLLESIYKISDILGSLPKNAYLTMKLVYNDEITPQDYEPPGFEPCDNEKFTFPSNAVKIVLGKVSTDVHAYNMYLKTALSKEPLSQISTDLEKSVLTDSQKLKNIIPPKDIPGDTAFESEEDIMQNSQTFDYTSDEIDCPCSCKQDSGTNILQCSSCGKKQHSICYGILAGEENESNFYCTHCINQAPFKITQDLIHTYKGKEQQELCALRRALVYCASLKNVSIIQLEKHLKCNQQLAKDVMKRLEFEGFIRKIGNQQKFKVNEKKIINNGYQEYFSTAENKENAESSQKTKIYDVRDDDKRNMNFRKKDELLSEDQLMDFAVDKEIEKLNLKGSFENKSRQNSKKRRSHDVTGNNDCEDSYQSQPKKRRFLNTKKTISVNE